jgi:hypothetical protein
MTIIHTRTCRAFNLSNPTPDQINIQDIAYALGNICRFTGHSESFYSVAEHCVRASCIPNTQERQLAALMHDAHEAYVGDVSSPLKQLIPEYKSVEDRAWEAVHSRFKIATDELTQTIVRLADLRMLATEKRDLMPQILVDWACLKDILPLHGVIRPMVRSASSFAFLARFEDLTETIATDLIK